jgi:hypothetical protein
LLDVDKLTAILTAGGHFGQAKPPLAATVQQTTVLWTVALGICGAYYWQPNQPMPKIQRLPLG